MTTGEALNQAIECERAGKLAEAEAICRFIMEQRPDLSAAWHLRSIVAARAGRPDAAVEFIGKAIAIDPTDAAAHSNLGEYYRRLGKTDAAISSLRRAIELQPEHSNSWNNLGNTLKDQGKLDDALAAYNKAAQLQPDFAIAHNNIGVVLRLKGNLDESLAAFDGAIALEPDYGDAHGNRGNALREKGRLDEAIAEYRRAIELSPDSASPHAGLGNALTDQGKFDEAIAEYQKALRLKADYPEALNNFANALREKERYEEATAAAREAIRLKPNYADAYNSLGSILFDQDRYDEAVDTFQQAIDLDPSCPHPHNNLGLALGALGRFDEAIAACHAAVQLDPQFAGGHSVLGDLLTEQGRHEEAIASFQRALEINPNYYGAHVNLSFVHLTRGDFEKGWAEYEWRKQGRFKDRPRQFAKPQWDGRNLNGRTILLHTEQGLGDAIQFVRFAPLVAARGGRVILSCQPELAHLFAGLAGVAEVVSGQVMPDFDVHCPLLSLPHVLGTRLETIPAETPYLNAPPQLTVAWKSRLDGDGGKLRVGLLWAGSPRHKRDRRRSLRLEQLSPLAAVGGVRFYSLQKGPPAAQAATPPAGWDLVDLSAELRSMSDTAAVIQNLDLVIGADTSVVHLAGALARPVWVLISVQSDFRWLLDRTDSPWYPTMRLFRQTQMNDWNTPIVQLAHELRKRVVG